MVATHSTMLDLGTPAPDFALPNPDGRVYSLADFADADVLIVAFICNHCPFVKHIGDGLAKFARDYLDKRVAIVAINANDTVTHPADSPANMRAEAQRRGYVFPYLLDESQDVAKRYRAACTPEFYVFDRVRQLRYRGRFDASRPSSDVPVTGADLRAAVDALLAGGLPSDDQIPSIGCNIKWRAGNEPEYFG